MLINRRKISSRFFSAVVGMAINPEEEMFYGSFGRAVATWQYVESGLYRILSEIIDCKNPAITSTMFFSIYGLQDKIRIVDSAIRIALKHDQRIEAWTRERAGLRYRVQRASQIRNKLAHYEAWSRTENGKEIFFLGRHSLDYRHEHPSGTDRIGWSALLDHALAFSALGNELWEYAATLASPKPWLEIAPELLAEALRRYDPTHPEEEPLDAQPPPEPSPQKPES